MTGAELLRRAQDQGLLPEQAVWPAAVSKPWPVLLLTALGAWLSAIPLAVALAFFLEPVVRGGASLYVLALMGLGAAVLLQRERAPLFLQQLALPALLIGFGLLVGGLVKDRAGTAGFLITAAVCLLMSVALTRAWLRLLMGACAVGLLLLALQSNHEWRWRSDLHWAALMLLALLPLWWLPRPVRWVEWGGALGSGWLLGLLLWLIVDAGSTWLISGLGPDLNLGWHGRARVPQFVAFIEVLTAAALMAWRWRGLRGWRWVAAAVLIAPLALLLPALGILALAAALCALQGRLRMLLTTALAALWVLGSFYYRVDWSLQDKGLGLFGLGVALALLARWPRRGAVSPLPMAEPWPWRAHAMAAGLLLGLAVVNVGIAQKEWQLQRGQVLFVELVPVDPRSLMQGDYMSVDYGLLRTLTPPGADPRGASTRLVVRRDARGVAQLQRVDRDGQALLEGELLLELGAKNGRWVLASDAWFFKEGEAPRWQRARYAELRVTGEGEAQLVGLRDADLKPL